MFNKLFLVFIVVFLLGWLANSIYGYLISEKSCSYEINNKSIITMNNSKEKNLNYIEKTKKEKLSFTENIFDKNPTERPSPYDWIKENQIHVYNNKVVIDIKNPEWATFTDTNSMDPIFDYGSHAIEIIPKGPEDIHVGDIVSYKSKYADGIIVHRVIKVSEDEKGWYAILKGDNNKNPDPGKIRFNQIERILVAIIY